MRGLRSKAAREQGVAGRGSYTWRGGESCYLLRGIVREIIRMTGAGARVDLHVSRAHV